MKLKYNKTLTEKMNESGLGKYNSKKQRPTLDLKVLATVGQN